MTEGSVDVAQLRAHSVMRLHVYLAAAENGDLNAECELLLSDWSP